MAPIADKHGLTNPYREIGHKRHLKRGRPRKYLFGPPSRRRRRITKKEHELAQKIGLCFSIVITLILLIAVALRN